MKRSRAVLPHLLAAVPLVAVISVRSVAQTADSSHALVPRLIGVFDSRTGAPLPDVQPTLFVDGFEWNTKMGAPTDLTPGRPAEGPHTPTNVKGVEVYMSEQNRPLRFTGDPTCGAIVIWTK
jgi:hypothetical protein